MAFPPRLHTTRRVLRFFILLLAITTTASCRAPTAPLMPDTSEPSPFPEDSVFGDKASPRGMLRLESRRQQPPEDVHQGEPFQGQLEGREGVGVWQGIADVVGFPFRAVGWLVQSIF